MYTVIKKNIMYVYIYNIWHVLIFLNIMFIRSSLKCRIYYNLISIVLQYYNLFPI